MKARKIELQERETSLVNICESVESKVQGCFSHIKSKLHQEEKLDETG